MTITKGATSSRDWPSLASAEEVEGEFPTMTQPKDVPMAIAFALVLSEIDLSLEKLDFRSTSRDTYDVVLDLRSRVQALHHQYAREKR